MAGKKTSKRKPKVGSAPATQAPTPGKPAKPEGAPSTPRTGSKIAKLVALLRRPGGATIETLVKATDWQAHSVRGAISGTIKKKLALSVKSERRGDGERVYSIR